MVYSIISILLLDLHLSTVAWKWHSWLLHSHRLHSWLLHPHGRHSWGWHTWRWHSTLHMHFHVHWRSHSWGWHPWHRLHAHIYIHVKIGCRHSHGYHTWSWWTLVVHISSRHTNINIYIRSLWIIHGRRISVINVIASVHWSWSAHVNLFVDNYGFNH